MALSGTNAHSHADNVDRATEIFDEYGDFILAIIRCRANNDVQADDLFQDFFISLVAKPMPQNIRNIKNFLYKMIINDIVDAARRTVRYRNRVKKYVDHFGYTINNNSPENAFIEAEEINKMFKLIEKRLPHRQMQAITLRYKNNYEIREVAQEMDVDERSVSRYISVGFSKIRQFLAVDRRGL